MPYPSQPHDKAGTQMPDGLWELVQWCWNRGPADRPAAPVIANALSDMAANAMPAAWRVQDEPTLETPVASGSRTSRPPREPASASNVPSVPERKKGEQRVRFEEFIVVFGPLAHDDGDPEEIFAVTFKEILRLVPRNALAMPLLVEEHEPPFVDEHASPKPHLALHFASLVEANNFAMTWMVDRFDPYEKVSARLVRNR
ncbi:hypothetical protein FB451DRAFT_1265289 [Mycena latifolia]|nr:hypothetical protein FB451DRAFT_1265289 [Mycena latifolia]